MNLELPLDYELDRYKIFEVLDRGGFSITYLATTDEQSTVLIKELCPANIVYRETDYSLNLVNASQENINHWNASRDALVSEAEVLLGIGSNGLPKCLDRFSANNTLYLVQEYIEGTNLFHCRDMLYQKLLEQPDFLEQFLISILTVLSNLHKAGVLHRDLKPANIMIRQGTWIPVIIDLGGARFQVGGKTTNFDRRVWSEGYSSYEQLDTTGGGQEQYQASDLYSLAATFYFLLFGEEPVDVLDRIKGEEVRSFGELKHLFPEKVLRSLDLAYQIHQEDRCSDAEKWIFSLDEDPHKLGEYITTYWLGRAPEIDGEGAAVIISDSLEAPVISRTHAKVDQFSNGYQVRDLSTNGTAFAVPPDFAVRAIVDKATFYSSDFTLYLAGIPVTSREILTQKAYVSECQPLSEVKVDNTHPARDSVIEKTELHYASFGQRLSARLVEAGILIIASCVVITVALAFGLAMNEEERFFYAAVFFIDVAIFFYAILFLHYRGKDIGKSLVKLTVVDKQSGQPPNWWRSFLRIFGYFLSSLTLGIGFLWALWDREKQALHDKLANTVVVTDG